jgi:hypothetical protein
LFDGRWPKLNSKIIIQKNPPDFGGFFCIMIF